MNKKAIFLFFLVIFSLKFFDAAIANTGVLKNLCYAYMSLSILLSLPYFFKYKGGFVRPLQLLCGSIFISIFMAQYTWGQGLSFAPTTIPYLVWCTFFYLLYLQVPIRTIETIVLIYGILYIILFLFQFTHTNVVYFGYHEEFKEDRGIIRVGFPGAGVFFLSCFMAINKVTGPQNRKRLLWLAYALAGVVVIVLQVTRQAIFCLLLVYLIHFLINVRLAYKIATIALFVTAGYAFLNSGTSISTGLAEQQKQDASLGKDYIRLLAAEYFLTEFTPNTASRILGNGFYNNNSSYGKIVTSLSENYGFYLTDVGLVEVYVLFGVFALLAYILIFARSILMPLPRDYYYLKYYLWMMMATCLTSDSLISPSFIITTVFVLYCYQRLHEQSLPGKVTVKPGAVSRVQ